MKYFICENCGHQTNDRDKIGINIKNGKYYCKMCPRTLKEEKENSVILKEMKEQILLRG